MTRSTQTDAWRLIRACADVTAGRLTGRCLRAVYPAPIPPGALAPDAARQLHDSIYRTGDTPAGPDSIWYVVSSDATPVAWLTRNATVITPPADRTSYQLDHQTKAVAALSQLTRRALQELAVLRDVREGRVHDQSPYPVPSPLDPFDTRVLAAHPADPTLTFWTPIGADLDTSRTHLAKLTGVPAGVEPLIVDTFGYGDYGRHREVFDLPVLCTIERLAAQQHLPADVIGDWLDLAGASRGNPTPEQIEAAFADAFAGIHDTRRGFAGTERDRRGWTAALDAAGIPASLFHLDAFTNHLFGADAHEVRLHDGRIAVFRRP
ncbi:hypothetical protein ACQP2P_15955 [Dactylosporangium sp. CA-139114]|uniref:hypothetical protein n=1 Tax=Dactylosporangium sp. CA-139114 TaxID=3239931 RepID=UPI003D95F9F9